MTKFKGAFAGCERYHELKKKMRTMIAKHKPPEEISAEIDRAYYSGELTLEETQHLYPIKQERGSQKWFIS